MHTYCHNQASVFSGKQDQCEYSMCWYTSPLYCYLTALSDIINNTTTLFYPCLVLYEQGRFLKSPKVSSHKEIGILLHREPHRVCSSATCIETELRWCVSPCCFHRAAASRQQRAETGCQRTLDCVRRKLPLLVVSNSALLTRLSHYLL